MPTAKERWISLAGCLLLAGCALGRSEPVTMPVSTQVFRGPLDIHADFPLEDHDPLFDELAGLRNRISTALATPLAEQPIRVNLFASSERFHATLAERFPGFPVRRAFFVKQQGRCEVYAQWGDSLAEDLRHEATHAYLHTTLSGLPLWLDEGLAEYFETPAEAAGWNAAHAELLLEELHAGSWRPDLARLEMLTAPGAMTQLDYAESWAWTWLLLNTTPSRREALHRYLHAIQAHQPTPPLSTILHHAEPDPRGMLIAMLHQATAATPRE